MRIFFYIILWIAPTLLQAQTISGSWYGRADVDLSGLHNNYLTELVIKQKGNRVEGIFGYYFRDKYQSFFIHGRYNPKTREIIILNLPVIYYGSNSTINSIDCMTNFRGILVTSRVGSRLTGTFYHDGRYKYMCPDLKVTYSLDREDNSQDSTLLMAARARVWKPQPDEKVVNEVRAAAPVAPVVGLPAGADSGVVRSDSGAVRSDSGVVRSDSGAVRSDSGAVRSDSGAVRANTGAAPVDSTLTAAAAAAVRDSIKLAASFAKRKAVLNRELLVESDSIRLSFYDNGEIDGDSISVFVNKELVLSHQGLEAKAFNIYLHLDSARELTEVSMFAENLGRIPPNTALMVITDGVNRYEVFLSSSLTENATVELRRKKR